MLKWKMHRKLYNTFNKFNSRSLLLVIFMMCYVLDDESEMVADLISYCHLSQVVCNNFHSRQFDLPTSILGKLC